MSDGGKMKFGLSLGCLLMLCSACSTTISYDNCPVWPVGGKAVGDVFRRLDVEDKAVMTEWASRLDKLRRELELCRQ